MCVLNTCDLTSLLCVCRIKLPRVCTLVLFKSYDLHTYIHGYIHVHVTIGIPVSPTYTYMYMYQPLL